MPSRKCFIRIGVVVLLGMLCFLGAAPASADAAEVSVRIDNEPVAFEVPPTIDGNGRTIVPIRWIAESLGYELTWDSATRTAGVRGRGRHVQLPIDSHTARVNDVPVALDAPARIVEGRTVVPLRFMMENFDAAVLYDGSTRTVYVSTRLPESDSDRMVTQVEVVVSTVLNVRSTPDIRTDNVMGQAHNGAVYPVLFFQDPWYRVDFHGTPGWIHADYTRPFETAAPPSGPEDQPGEVPTRTVSRVRVDVSYGSSLNVRSAPWGGVVGKLSRGDTLPYLATEGEWYRVEYAGTQAYVHRDWTSLVTVTEVDLDKVEARRGRVNSAVVNVRSTPVVTQDNSNRITQVTFGNEYEILQTRDDWYQIRLDDGQPGWIIQRAVDLIDRYGNVISREGADVAARTRVMIVGSDNVNIRSGPGASHEVVGKAQTGDVFEILEIRGDWNRVSLSNLGDGYIAAWLGETRTEIRFEGQEEAPAGEEPAVLQVTADGTDRLRAQADQDLSYKVFVLNDPARALVQFYGVRLEADHPREIPFSGGRLAKATLQQQGPDQVRMILSFGSAASLDVTGDARDGQKTVRFQVEDAPLAGRTVMIDPGHGTYRLNGNFDVGAVSPSGFYEYIAAGEISREVQNRLVALGATVLMTHDTTRRVTLDLEGRVQMANAAMPDIFVSVHSDSMPTNPLASGMTAYYYNGNGNISEKVALASALVDNLSLYTARANNGIKRQTFRVIRYTNMPSVLLEVGFLSNPTEEKLLQTSSFRSLAAEGIVQGILEYFQRR